MRVIVWGPNVKKMPLVWAYQPGHLLGSVIRVVLGIGMPGVAVVLDLGQERRVVEVRLLALVLVLEQEELWRKEEIKGKNKVQLE